MVSSTDYTFNLHSGYDQFNVPELKGRGYFEVIIECVFIPVGIYNCSVYLFAENNLNLVRKYENAGRLEIMWRDDSPRRSLLELPHRWLVEPEPGAQ